MTAPLQSSERARMKLQSLALAVLLMTAFSARVWYANTGLDQSRFYDERYTYENVDSFLQGKLYPANGWYPSLSYLPPTILTYTIDRIATRLSPETWRLKRSGVFSPLVILACRVLQAVYGVTSIWLLFLIGRRIFDPVIGLTAAFVLAVAPGHIRLSAVVKPDILMIALLLLVVLVVLKLADGLTWPRVLLAGALVGLTVAAKQYGVVAAIPVCAAVLLGRPGWRRAITFAGGAMATAAAVFVATNPWIGLLIHYADRNRRLYGEQGGDRLDVLVGALQAPFSETGHGALLGTLATAGIVILSLAALRSSTPMARRRGIVLILVTLVGYIGFCVAFLPWSKYNLWVPVIPLTSLAVAVAVLSLVRRFRSVVRSAAFLAPVLGFAVLIAGALPGLGALYEDRVPTTEAMAERLLRARWRNVKQRLVYQEQNLEALLAKSYWADQFVVARVESLAGQRQRRLDYADAEVFPASRLDGADGEFYRRRMEAFGDRVVRVEPGPFSARGEKLIVIEHGWRRVGRPIDIDLWPGEVEGKFVGTLHGLDRQRAFVSFELWLRTRSNPRGVMTVGSSTVVLFADRNRPGYTLFLTERLRIPPSLEQPISIRLPAVYEHEEETFTIRLHRWQRVVTPDRSARTSAVKDAVEQLE